MLATNLSVEMVWAGNCWSCGVPVYIPKSKYDSCQSNAKHDFYCCNGHSAVFKKNRATELEEELERERAKLKAEIAKREMAERSVSAAKGQITKIKNRVGNGVCPCCNRSFTNLRRHMHTKHPGYKDEAS